MHTQKKDLLTRYERIGKRVLAKSTTDSILVQTVIDRLSAHNTEELRRIGEDTSLPPRMKWLKASTASPDRHGDVMNIAGAEFENFIRNPQFLWMHGISGESVGTIGRIIRLVRTPTTLYALAEYLPEGASALADKIHRLDSLGYLPANSIGFRPIEWEENSHGGFTIIKWELLEISKVELPANPHAIDE